MGGAGIGAEEPELGVVDVAVLGHLLHELAHVGCLDRLRVPVLPEHGQVAQR
jgi:hypothetical protein